MLPLVYIFTIQNTSPQALTLYRTSYIVQHLEMKFSVEVTYRHYFAFPLADLIFRNHPAAKFLASSNTIVVSVRGLAFFSQQVIEATNILLEHHFGKVAASFKFKDFKCLSKMKKWTWIEHQHSFEWIYYSQIKFYNSDEITEIIITLG